MNHSLPASQAMERLGDNNRNGQNHRQQIAALTKELVALKAAGGRTGTNLTGENYRPTKPGPKCKYCDRWHPKVAQKDCYKKKGNTAPDWFVARQKKAAAKAAEKAAGGAAGKA